MVVALTTTGCCGLVLVPVGLGGVLVPVGLDGVLVPKFQQTKRRV